MATGQERRVEGYDEERFEHPVSQDLQCVICTNVFKDPVMCQRNQHHFCRACIARHLTNTQDCPVCKDPLTMETTQPAQRVLKQWLSSLTIRCDYFQRGCLDFIKLNDLQTHILNCGFAPAICPNEGCNAEVNQRDMAHHRSTTCEFCQLKEIAQLKRDVALMMAKIERIETTQTRMLERMEGHQAKMERIDVNEVKAMKTEVTELNKRVTEEQNKLKHNIRKEIEDQFSTECQHLQQTVNENVSEEAATRKSHSKKTDHHIIIAGSYLDQSVEHFCWSSNAWSPLQPMREGRLVASSTIFQNQMIVAGGSGTNTIEALRIDPVEMSEPWHEYPAKLPQTLYGHKSVLYNDSLITVGGYNGSCECVDTIYEVQLVPPYQTKMLGRLAQRRAMHGVEILDDDIFICGGTRSKLSRDCVNNVELFNMRGNSCKQLMPLPYPVCEMATVLWSRNVVVLGGRGCDGRVLSSVVMYCVEDGKCYCLPEMKRARSGCSAVVVDDGIVVMGGMDENRHKLRSVEYFHFSNHRWEDLPPMREARSLAAAIAW